MFCVKVEIFEGVVPAGVCCEQLETATTMEAKPTYREILQNCEKLSGEENSDARVPFKVGNPNIEETVGYLHLYKDNNTTKRTRLPVKKNLLLNYHLNFLQDKRGRLLAVLAVPSLLSISDFCHFVGPFQKYISHMRILRHTHSFSIKGNRLLTKVPSFFFLKNYQGTAKPPKDTW